MKIKLILFVFFLVSTFSCGEKAKNANEPKTFSLEITDSIYIDHLGDMMLLDYDPQGEKYLVATEEPWEYMEVDDHGKILNHNKFKTDGIDVVQYPASLGYFKGEVTVLNKVKGYFMFQDSSKVGELSIPYPFDIYMKNPNLDMVELEERIYYPHPLPGAFSPGDGSKFFHDLYRLPVIESQDKTTHDTLGVARLPETSVLLDGKVHGFLIPGYTMDKDQLLLITGIDPKLYVYNIIGDQFEYERTVDLAIPGWVSYTAYDTPEQFFSENMKMKPGMLTNIFVVGDYYIVTYNRGISEDLVVQLDPATRYSWNVFKKDPHFAAIFDKDFKQLASEVPFPLTSNRPMVVNKKGELVVSKVAGLSETEDDGIILYKLKLTED